MESIETRKKNDELIKFFIKRMFKKIAKMEFSAFAKEKDGLILFYKYYFNLKIDNTQNALSSKLYEKILFENKSSENYKDIQNVKNLVIKLHSKPEFKQILDVEYYKRLNNDICRNYYN